MNARTQHTIVFGILVVLFVLSLAYFGYGNYRAGSSIGFVLLNSLILAIPMAALFFSVGLIVEVWQQHRAGRVSPRMAKFLYFTPRVAGLLIALFTGMFALDVFEMQGSTWEKIGAFFIHAAPAIAMLVLLVLAWRWPWVGTLVFGCAALFFLRFVIGARQFGFGNLLLFVLPMALVAALFWMNWRWRTDFILE